MFDLESILGMAAKAMGFNNEDRQRLVDLVKRGLSEIKAARADLAAVRDDIAALRAERGA